MQTKDDLIRENTILRARLELAERWMQREVQRAMQEIQTQSVKSQARKHFANLLEEEGTDIIASRIYDTFGDSLQSAPEFTLERLIDAEIYWQTLQKYPTMDGLPVILAYQKILDAWVEEKLIRDFRFHHRDQSEMKRGDSDIMNMRTGLPHFSKWQRQDGLERDIQNIITKKYTLSIGRLYQILEQFREDSILPLDTGGRGNVVSGIVDFWNKKSPEILTILISDDFFVPFSELMNREIFTKKRHETKVTFSDVKKTREILIEKGILLFLFKF